MKHIDIVFVGCAPNLAFIDAEVDGSSITIGAWLRDETRGFSILRITEGDLRGAPSSAKIGFDADGGVATTWLCDSCSVQRSEEVPCA